MNPISQPKRGNLFARSALGIALAFGVAVGGAAVSTPAFAAKDKAPKLNFSKGFLAAAVPAQTAVEKAKGRSEVEAAKAQLNAALQSRDEAKITSAEAAVSASIAEEKALIDQAFAVIENEDDRFFAGNLAVNLGSIAGDANLQRQGIKAMLASGKLGAEDIPRFNGIAGQLAYQAGDYAEAHKYLQVAVDSGFTDNNTEALLSEAYIADNNPTQGLAVLKKALVSHAATGTPAPENWYRRGLATTYKAGMLNDAVEFGSLLIKDYPQPANVGMAATIVRELGQFSTQETLDLMRLMGRTNSYAEQRDYIEYIEAADTRRNPSEALEVIEAGLAAGKLSASDTSVADWRTQAQGRIAADKASLSSYESDARKPSATEAIVTGAADALLSYKQPAKAEELYTLALGKPGADTPRVLTRLGIAQMDQGKYAAAQETFGKVTGKRTSIAKLWQAYAASKAATTAQ